MSGNTIGNTHNVDIFYEDIPIFEKIVHKIFKGVDVSVSLPTLRLLSASIVVAVSGAFRLYIAFLLLNIEPDINIYLAGFLVIYATYTMDRSVGCEEDKVNRQELGLSNGTIAIFVSLTALLIAAYFLTFYDLVFIAFLPSLVGYIYTKGVHVGNYNFKLKGNLGVKNVVVAMTWGINIAGVAQHFSRNMIALFSIFSFFTLKSFINTIIYDFRDVEGDSIAGLKTLPIYWGEKKAKLILQILHNSLHLWILIAMLMCLISSQLIILFICWLAGILYITFLTKQTKGNETRMKKIMRDVLVDGEFILAVCLKVALDSLI